MLSKVVAFSYRAGSVHNSQHSPLDSVVSEPPPVTSVVGKKKEYNKWTRQLLTKVLFVKVDSEITENGTANFCNMSKNNAITCMIAGVHIEWGIVRAVSRVAVNSS